MIAAKTLKTLEYDKILTQLAQHASSCAAKAAIARLLPQTDEVRVQALLDETAQADKALYEHCATPQFAFDTMDEDLLQLSKSAVLSAAQIMRCGRLLRASRRVRQTLDAINDPQLEALRAYTAQLTVDRPLEQDISDAIVGENEISDRASVALGNVRRSLRVCNERIRQKLQDYISGGNYAKYLQDNLITMRNDRYVVPVKSECKGQIDGLVHDRSDSGATLYVEPIAIVRLNNELRTLELEEEREIALVLQRFSFRLSEQLQALEQSYDALTRLDVIFAKAAYGHAMRAVRPTLNTRGALKILKGRHPLIAADKVVPVTLEIGQTYRTLVVTGPNTGGKTVSLKLAGLLSLMAMSGIYVPADEQSEVCVWNGVFCDIGDEQSIEQSLSTYSSHVRNLIEITHAATPNSLILLDELGAGTDPLEGSSLAIAVIEYLREKGCVTIATSHYTQLKEYSYSTDGVCNAGMDFDPITFEPTYRLVMGVSGSSNALAIAQNLGLDAAIVRHAKQLLGSEKVSFDRLIAAAERQNRQARETLEQATIDRQETQKALRDAERERERWEEKNKQLDEKLSKHAKELLQDYLDDAQELVEQIRLQVKQGDEKALFEARRLRKRLEARAHAGETYEHPSKRAIEGEITIGDRVYVKSLRSEGEVVSINPKRKECTVKAGILTSAVKMSDLQKIRPVEPAPRPQASVSRGSNPDPASRVCPSELMLIGMHADEAVYRCEQYLSDALMYGYPQVRIVHGKGSGTLRNAIAELLKKHPSVDTFRLGAYGEGEDGVTIVTFK